MNLLDIPILSTALAIVISWALYALFCSYVLEAWVQIKAERGRFMKNYLYLQLLDSVNGINWADRIYSHGAIDLLSRDPKKPTNDISPKLFAETLIEVVGGSQIVQSQIDSFQQRKLLHGNYSSPPLKNFSYATQILNPSDLVTLFRHAISNAESKVSRAADGSVDEAEIFNQLTIYLDRWFTELTERLTLWYKKRTRERLFYLGVFVGLLINVDSIELFSFYEDNPVAKAAVIQYYKDHPEVFQSRVDSAAAENTQVDTKAAAKKFSRSMDSLVTASKIPVGWKYNLISQYKSINLRKDPAPLIFKILGILISGLAASFGAPFWFDVLKKATSKP